MKAENIDIVSFLVMLKTFQSKGATIFGLEIRDNGNHITLFPMFPETEIEKKEAKQEEEDEDDDDEFPIKDLKA